MRPLQWACLRCGERWRQDKTSYCRRCRREMGDERTVRELEAARGSGKQAPPVLVDTFRPAPRRTIRLPDGTLAELAWNGTAETAHPRTLTTIGRPDGPKEPV